MRRMDNRRYYGLDALRGAMMLLGIVLHGVGFYIAMPPPHLPIPVDRNTSYAADLVFGFIHSFRMPAFFLLAGFFASLLVEKRGLAGMFRDRAARVAAPMVAAVVLLLPPTMIFVLDFMLAVRFGTMELVPDMAKAEVLVAEMRAAGFPVDKPSIGHLWFLYYLCIFYAIGAPLLRLLVSHNARVEAFLRSGAGFFALGLVGALTLWPYRGGQVQEGFIFLEPHIPSLIYYGSFFCAGYVLHHHRGMLEAMAGWARRCALAAAVLFPVATYASYLDNFIGGVGYHVASVLANSFLTWAVIYAAMGGALRYFDRASPWTLYASQSAYWVYLVHMPFACLAAWLLVPFDMHAMMKAAFVMAFTTGASFLTYHYFVQRTWIGRFLHGKRFELDWPWRAPRVPLPLAVS
jgi:glucans biosynthesis protein C